MIAVVHVVRPDLVASAARHLHHAFASSTTHHSSLGSVVGGVLALLAAVTVVGVRMATGRGWSVRRRRFQSYYLSRRRTPRPGFPPAGLGPGYGGTTGLYGAAAPTASTPASYPPPYPPAQPPAQPPAHPPAPGGYAGGQGGGRS